MEQFLKQNPQQALLLTGTQTTFRFNVNEYTFSAQNMEERVHAENNRKKNKENEEGEMNVEESHI
ncbi:MAG TPA: hypothetical protein PLS50_05275 [Candidatus Dojkabacteria bacterium]|nr:hypothetical protein [Ferruginibacter sp.]HRP37194.1 hypothetical protein [Candidatus Dojkabacteria bacterium]